MVLFSIFETVCRSKLLLTNDTTCYYAVKPNTGIIPNISSRVAKIVLSQFHFKVWFKCPGGNLEQPFMLLSLEVDSRNANGGFLRKFLAIKIFSSQHSKACVGTNHIFTLENVDQLRRIVNIDVCVIIKQSGIFQSTWQKRLGDRTMMKNFTMKTF